MVNSKPNFTSETDYLKSLSFFCRSALHTSLKIQVGDAGNIEFLSTGSAPTIANYSDWSLTPVGLLITFGDYQVASYAEGESRVLIPYSKIKHIMKPEFHGIIVLVLQHFSTNCHSELHSTHDAEVRSRSTNLLDLTMRDARHLLFR